MQTFLILIITVYNFTSLTIVVTTSQNTDTMTHEYQQLFPFSMASRITIQVIQNNGAKTHRIKSRTNIWHCKFVFSSEVLLEYEVSMLHTILTIVAVLKWAHPVSQLVWF